MVSGQWPVVSCQQPGAPHLPGVGRCGQLILTIEELLAGKNIDRPQGAADATFKRARRAAANMNLPLD